jgi:hypothetical protein
MTGKTMTEDSVYRIAVFNEDGWVIDGIAVRC